MPYFYLPSIYDLPSPYLELLTGLIGLCVGSFLNVVAIRSLAGQSILKPPSQCPKCDHRLGFGDLFPVFSYFLLGGKCRYCKASIHWHYPAVEILTAIAFVAVVHFFGTTPVEVDVDRSTIALYMLLFVSTLIAVTVTDFKEKLIPHDITYPMMLVGIFFSTFIRHDLMGCLAGIGVSYILFDFIAHYGLIFYYWLHPELLEEKPAKAAENLEEDSIDIEIDRNFGLTEMLVDEKEEEEEEEEPLEVMGGADAVLAAVMAAWLGWERLIIAVIIGFMVGAAMGAYYLYAELRQQKLLGRVVKPMAIGFGIMTAVPLVVLIFLALYFKPDNNPLLNPSIYVMIFALGLAGATFGVLNSGVLVTKTFPFGPALAIGAAYAISTISLTKDGGFIKPGA